MKLKFSLDIGSKSTWFVKTPSQVSKQLPFYINECGHYIANARYYTERQGQRNYLLLYTVSGSGYLKYADMEYTLEKNQAVVIYCDRYHLYRTASDKPWDFKWIHFNGTSAKEHYTLLNEDSVNVIHIEDSVNFEKMVDDLTYGDDINDISANVNASAKLTKVLSYLITCRFSLSNNKKYDEHRNEIEKIICYIQLNYKHKISLNDLTKIAYMSKFYFLRVFKKHTGVSPYEYLLNYRINKAKEGLKSTALTVGEIGEDVGFGDYNNFIREFKKVVGTTPLNYKKHSI